MVNIYFVPHIHRLFGPYRNSKIWKVGYGVRNLAVLTASLTVRETVKTNTPGLVSKHEHGQNRNLCHVIYLTLNL